MITDPMGKTDPEAASDTMISVIARRDAEERGRKGHRRRNAGNYRDRG